MANGQAFGFINVGRKRTGKTTVTMSILDKIISEDKNRDIFVFDINAEYSDYYDEPFVAFEDFMKKIENVKNSLILFEEATIFFDTRSTDKVLTNKLVRTRHENNIIILNFHSWAQVPKPIFSLIDFVQVFKTNDSLNTVKSKIDNEKILKAFNKVQKSENDFEKLLINLYDK